jgi:putative mRNA 3-end processing factor
MLPTRTVSETVKGQSFAGELVLAPPSAGGSTWMRRFGPASTAFASGWMRVRGTRRRRGFDRGFTLSDHADWPDLLRTIAETGAERVLTTHGFAEPLARYLRERGLPAGTLATPYEGEEAAD